MFPGHGYRYIYDTYTLKLKDMDCNHYCIIMAGGTRSRFWPMSREERPTQFLDIAGGGMTFLRMTYERCAGIVPAENILVVTLDRYRDHVLGQIPELPEENLLLEPYGRNTAPCLTYAMYTLLKRNPDSVMAATPADLVISDGELFRETMRNAFDYAAENDVLMTLGVVPSYPDTNFGYIQVQGGRVDAFSDKPLKVKTFTEKPDEELAAVFCKSGEFFWNSGILVCRTGVIREEMERYLPEITSLFADWGKFIGTPGEEDFIRRAYTDCPKVSIDYGVMEKTDRAWLCPAKFGWSDINCWEALYRQLPHKDDGGNAVDTDKCLSDGNRDCLIVSRTPGKLIAVKGLENYIVVDTDDVLLVCPKDDKTFRDFISGLGMPDFEDFR